MIPTTATSEQRTPQIPIKTRSCKTCVKLDVCAVIRAIAPLLESWADKKPFEPEELSTICKKYVWIGVNDINDR